MVIILSMISIMHPHLSAAFHIFIISSLGMISLLIRMIGFHYLALYDEASSYQALLLQSMIRSSIIA